MERYILDTNNLEDILLHSELDKVNFLIQIYPFQYLFIYHKIFFIFLDKIYTYNIYIYMYIYRVYQATHASQISRKPRTTDKNISDKSYKVSSNVLYSNIGMTLNSVVKIT